jgi:hypothetical protein
LWAVGLLPMRDGAFMLYVCWAYLLGVCCHIATHSVWSGGLAGWAKGVGVVVMHAVLCLPGGFVVQQRCSHVQQRSGLGPFPKG